MGSVCMVPFLRNPVNFIVVFIFIFGCLFSSVFSFGLEHPTRMNSEWFSGMFQNLGSEFLGAIATFILIELFVGGREKQESYQQLQQLYRARIMKAAEPTQIAFIIGEMNTAGLLKGINLANLDLRGVNLAGAILTGACLHKAIISDADLVGATLQNVDLKGADLQQTKLMHTDMRRAKLVAADLYAANLTNANLGRAELGGANLSGAQLHQTILEKASLVEADLSFAEVIGADLSGADLTGAKLTNAQFRRTYFDRSTIMPDGKKYRGQSSLRQFTAPVITHTFHHRRPQQPYTGNFPWMFK